MYFEVLVSIKEYKLKFYGFSKNVSSSVKEYLRIYFYPGVLENVFVNVWENQKLYFQVF